MCVFHGINMERNINEEVEDNETCAPEIICVSGESDFDESDFDCPISQSADIFNLPKEIKKAPAKNLQFAPTPSQSICVNCWKTYNKSLNMMCSCTFHSQPWNGRIYECCNQTYINSTGCKSGKHTEIKEKSKETQRLCTSCRESGHISKDCPKDPNTRTGINPLEELQRISKLNSNKFQVKPVQTLRKYEFDKNDFNDIANLKATIQAKSRIQAPSKCTSLTTEEAELSFLKPR